MIMRYVVTVEAICITKIEAGERQYFECLTENASFRSMSKKPVVKTGLRMLACVMKTFSYDAGLNLKIIEIDTDRKGLCGLMSGFDFQFNLSKKFRLGSFPGRVCAPFNFEFEVNPLMSTIDDPVLVLSIPLFEGCPFHRNLLALRTSSTVPDPRKMVHQ